MKLITELINSLEDEDEENLLLYEEKIEHKADHYHQRILLSQTKDGQDLIKLDQNKTLNGEKRNGKSVIFTKGVFQNSDGELREMTKSGILGMARKSESKPRPNRWGPSYQKGLLSKSTRGGMRFGQSGNKPINVARSVDEHEVILKRGRSLSVGERRGAAGINNSEFVNEINRKRINEDESLKGSMTERFDIFAKENDFLRKIIRSGEENAKHLKDCVFKLIEVFKEKEKKDKNDTTNHERVEHIERIERVHMETPKKEDEEKTVDIKINHSFLQKQSQTELPNVKITVLKRENERLKERVRQLMNEKNEEIQKKRKAVLKEDEMEMDLEKVKGQLKLFKREKQELDEEVEELRNKVRQWKKKYRDEAEKGWNNEDMTPTRRTWRDERKLLDLEEEMKIKSRDVIHLRAENDRLLDENRLLKKDIDKFKEKEMEVEGTLLKGKQKGKNQENQLEQKDKMILKLIEYVKELKLTIQTLEEEIDLLQKEIDRLSVNIKEFDTDKPDLSSIKRLEKDLKMKNMDIRKLERKIRLMTNKQNLEKIKSQGKNQSLNLKIKYLNETKTKLSKKIASLKDVNKRQTEILKGSTVKTENPISISAFESKKSNKHSSKKRGHMKYTSEVGRRIITSKKSRTNKNVFNRTHNKKQSHRQSNIQIQKKVKRQYNSHSPISADPYHFENEYIQRRYPQAPKHAAIANNAEFFDHQQHELVSQIPRHNEFTYRKHQEEIIENENLGDETLEKYVPVYMIGDQYIPVEEYNRLKMLGEIDDSEEEEEEEDQEREEGEEREEDEDEEMDEDDEEEEEEINPDEYHNAIEDYRQQIEEYQVNGYSRDELPNHMEIEHEDEEEDIEEEDEEDNDEEEVEYVNAVLTKGYKKAIEQS
jgi:hypothetical protein